MNDTPVNPEPRDPSEEEGSRSNSDRIFRAKPASTFAENALTEQQQRVLIWSKRAIVVMTALIFLGLAVIAAVLVKRGFAKPEVAAREDAIRILLPQGSIGNVHAVSLQDNRLTFAVDSGQGSAIYVMDIATGKMISEIQLVRQGAPVAMR